MKIFVLIFGLLILNSIRSHASNCEISLWNNDGAVNLNETLLSSAREIISKKGLTLTADPHSSYKAYFQGIGYIYRASGDRMLTPAGVIVSLESSDLKMRTQVEDLLVLRSRQNERMQKLSLKALRKAIANISYCD